MTARSSITRCSCSARAEQPRICIRTTTCRSRWSVAASLGDRHLVYTNDTPMTNLLLTMLDKAGVPAETLGDSTGRLNPEPLGISERDMVKGQHDRCRSPTRRGPRGCGERRSDRGGEESRRSNACQVLLQKRADPNAAEPDGTTALHWARTERRSQNGGPVDHLGSEFPKTATRYGVTRCTWLRPTATRPDRASAARGRRMSMLHCRRVKAR